MPPPVAALTPDLPADSHDRETMEQALGEIVSKLAHRPVPTGRLLRLWNLGSLQVRVGAGYLAYWLRSAFAPDEARRLLRHRAHLDAAVRLVAGMGYLKGAIMKVGQTLAAYPSVVPAELVDMLGSLHFEAPPMHFSLLREHLRNELGDDPENVFDQFEVHAFAAASLGQVHRARLKTGEEVAVKIQYPNIARTITDDMRNLKTLLAPMRLMRDWDNLLDQFEELRHTLELEADYRCEAQYTRQAREALADLPDVVVPKVFEQVSSQRVLTTEFIEGDHLPGFLAHHPSQEMRDRHGSQILRTSCRLFYAARMNHADPSPGNYLFREDGSLGLIDFGCCRLFNDEEWDYMLLGVRALTEGGTATNTAIQRGALLSDEEMHNSDRVEAIRANVEWMWEPFRHEGDFQVDDDYMRRGFETLSHCLLKRYTRSEPVNVWNNRMFYGSRAMLHQLGSRIPAKRIHDEELAFAGLLP